MPIFNDLDLNKWKETEVITDSLWLIPKRDSSGKHDGFYHGNFIPQIPKQLILRYTRKDDVILDPFVGSGTSAYVAEELSRNFIGIDIKSDMVEHVKSKVDNKKYFSEIIQGDSADSETFIKVSELLNKNKKNNAQLVILHPPYADILKFSDDKNDLSNAESVSEFLKKFSSVVKNSINVLEKNRYLAVVIGDKYSKGEWVPLGFYCMNEAQKLGLTLKSIIIKDVQGNRAKQNKEGIWKYRALSSDYYIFKHEYVLVFKH